MLPLSPITSGTFSVYDPPEYDVERREFSVELRLLPALATSIAVGSLLTARWSGLLLAGGIWFGAALVYPASGGPAVTLFRKDVT